MCVKVKEIAVLIFFCVFFLYIYIVKDINMQHVRKEPQCFVLYIYIFYYFTNVTYI